MNFLRAPTAALVRHRVVGKAIIYASRSLVAPDIPVDDVMARSTAFASRRSPMFPGRRPESRRGSRS